MSRSIFHNLKSVRPEARETRRSHTLVISGNKNLHKALRMGPIADARLPNLVIGNLWNVASGVAMQSATQLFTACIDEMCDNFTIETKELMFDVPDDGRPPDVLKDCIEGHYDMLMKLGVLEGNESVVENMREKLEDIMSNVGRDDVLRQVMSPKFDEVYSIGGILPRLNRLATWAPTAARVILEEMLRKILDVWTQHRDHWLGRCEHAIRSVREMATGIENGDFNILGPALQPMRHTFNELAWMLCALGDAGFSSPGFATVLADAALVLQQGLVAQLQLPQLPQQQR